MNLVSTQAVSPVDATNMGSRSGLNTLSSTDFIKILVAEFKNQDPTQPTDPTQFASQMVQFSNLGQLEHINAAVQQSPSTNLMQAASAFIGRQVVAAGNSIGLKGGKATSIVYAPAQTDNYTAMVMDSTGRVVDTVDLGKVQGGGVQNFSWSPSSSIADGSYRVQIINSRNVAVSGLLEQGVVQNVSLTSSGAASLDLGNLSVSEQSVAQVAQP